MKKLLSALVRLAIRGYQKSFSVFFGRQCRFYPSCSHYALWLFDFDKPLVAFGKSCLRVFLCNPLHKGGIDYPKMSLTLTLERTSHFFLQKHIKYWLIPYKNPMFLVTITYPKQIRCLFVIIKSF
ncbi:membrane protein insertion efficiency factor YidD [uncultured Helicobacter sp.]|uniref:membrane protein insertion efficiency factor YidD n=1 Tax=uncultured Helicobacter sp. TaxID=175537 RepID=UPI00374FD1FE